MLKIPTIGFSAYLKLVCIKESQQKRALRERYSSGKKGYDFHRSLRLMINGIAIDKMPVHQALGSLNNIKKKAEKNSATNGIKRFLTWLSPITKPFQPCESLTFSSPNKNYKILFKPDFLTELSGRRTAVHIWNTKTKLSEDIVLASLCAVASRYPDTHLRPDDFAVLSLQDGKLYAWSESSPEHRAMGEDLLLYIEKMCSLVRNELGLPLHPDSDGPSPMP